jgi:hypothetical protein
MKIENLIETPESRLEYRRKSFIKVQYFCLGVAAAALAGYANAWWKTVETATAFLVLFIIIGICKVRSCRPAPHLFILPPENVVGRTIERRRS